MDSVILAVAGALITTGLVLAVIGTRPTPRPAPAPPSSVTRLMGRVRSVRLVPIALGWMTGVFTWAVTGWPVAGLGAAAGVIAWSQGQSTRARRVGVIERAEALSGWCRRLADLLTAGVGGLERALAASVSTCPEAIRPEVTALVAHARTQGMETALRSFADELDDPAGDQIAASLLLRSRAGGTGLTTVLTGLAEALAAQTRARRAVEVDRAKARTNVRSVVVITVVVLVGLTVFARGFLDPFDTPAGQIVLAIVAALFAGAFGWMRALSRPVRLGRFLNPTVPVKGVGT